jgi:hypothetical protein
VRRMAPLYVYLLSLCVSPLSICICALTAPVCVSTLNLYVCTYCPRVCLYSQFVCVYLLPLRVCLHSSLKLPVACEMCGEDLCHAGSLLGGIMPVSEEFITSRTEGAAFECSMLLPRFVMCKSCPDVAKKVRAAYD